MSLNRALVPDCGDSRIEIYWRCVEKHITKHIYIIWLLMKSATRKLKNTLQRVGWRVTSPILNLHLYLLEFTLCFMRHNNELPQLSHHWYYRPFHFGFLVSTSGTPAGMIYPNNTFKGGSAGTPRQTLLPVSLMSKLAMWSTAKASL